MRMLKVLGIVLVGAVVATQFVPIDRTNPPVESDVAAPPEVKPTLRAACYDCHSNETVWPWYGRIAPVSWLLAYDVSKGREELNLSTWQRYDVKKREKKLKETVETVNDGEMPPWYYVMVHPAARLSEQERQALVAWASQGTAAASGGSRSGPEVGDVAEAD